MLYCVAIVELRCSLGWLQVLDCVCILIELAGRSWTRIAACGASAIELSSWSSLLRSLSMLKDIIDAIWLGLLVMVCLVGYVRLDLFVTLLFCY